MPDSYESFVPPAVIGRLTPAEHAVLKQVFSTPEGQDVLKIILQSCKFMEPCDNERDMALNNFAKELVAEIYLNRNTNQVKFHKIVAFVQKKLRRRRRDGRVH